MRVDGAVFPDEPVVIAFKPVPDSITGTVVGSHAVGRGRLLLCQYRLADEVLQQDSAARALLSDLMRWAAAPRQPMARTQTATADGREVTSYSYRTSGESLRAGQNAGGLP